MLSRIGVYWRQSGYPVLHHSKDNGEWVSTFMTVKNKGVFSIDVEFKQLIRFVICNQSKTNWYNPHKQLSDPSTYIKQNQNTNYVIIKSGEYLIINSIMKQVATKSVQNKKQRELIVVNVDGVLVGDELSLLHFNMLWMARYYQLEEYKLIYTTGRSKEDVLGLRSIILPEYLICEGGSYVYKRIYSQTHLDQYELISSNVVQEQQLTVLLQLSKFGFYKTNQQRTNSYVIFKPLLISNNASISQYLQKLNFDYQMVEETDVVYFDFLPREINKYSALQLILNEFKDWRVIAFGSNLSDFSLMYYANKCITPVNAQQRLVGLLEGKVVRSEGEFAEALVEYFEEIIE